MHDPKRSGELGEAIFVQRALTRGLRVAEPCGDSDPFDRLVGNGQRFWRVQIKSTMALPRNDIYQLSVSRLTAPPHRRIPYTPSEVDFFAIVLVPEDTVYIVPIEDVDGRVGLTFHARHHPKFGRWLPYFEAFDLLHQTGERPILPEDEPNAASPRRLKPM